MASYGPRCRITAAGPPGSATRNVALQLLGNAQLRENDVSWDNERQAEAAANALLEGQVDALISIGSSDAPTVGLLSRSAGVFMLGGQMLVVTSIRAGEVSAVVPFRYSAMLWTLLLSAIIWHYIPNFLTMLGIIVENNVA